MFSYKRRSHSSSSVLSFCSSEESSDSKPVGRAGSFRLPKSPSCGGGDIPSSDSLPLVRVSSFTSDWAAYEERHPCSVDPTEVIKVTVNRITEAADHAEINSYQCKFLGCFVVLLVNKLHEQWGNSYSLDTPAGGVFQELATVTTRCHELISSCGGRNWLERAVLREENREEFRGMFLEFCKTLMLVNRVLAGTSSGSRQETYQYVTEILESLQTTSLPELEIHARKDRSDMLQKVKALLRRSSKSGPLRKTGAETDRGLSSVTLHARLEKRDFMIDQMDVQRIKVIGSGTHGNVYHVKWLRQTFAEKTFGSECVGLQREVAPLFQVIHPNVVRVVGLTPRDGGFSLVTELMSTSLSAVLAEKRRLNTASPPFTFEVSLEIILQVAQGMRYLHDIRIMHRDLRTKNLLVKFSSESFTNQLIVKVSDFGLSRSLSKPAGTRASRVVAKNSGSSRFTAPEVLRDNTSFTKQADVYSFAMTCYEILTGEEPFSGVDDVEPVLHQGGRPRLREATCPRFMSDYISRCWHHQPSTRPTFSEICEFLGLIKELSLRSRLLDVPIFSAVTSTELETLIYHLGEAWLLDDSGDSQLVPVDVLKEWLQREPSSNSLSKSVRIKVQVRMGNAKANWKGTEHNFAEARTWYRMAANLGDAEAQWRLGMLYERGDGIQPDVTQALAYYKQAAAQDNVNAVLDVGRCYSFGLTEQSDELARKYFTAVCEKQTERGEVVGNLKELMQTLTSENARDSGWASMRLWQMTCRVREGRMVVVGPGNENLEPLLELLSSEKLPETVKYNLVKVVENLCLEGRVLQRFVYVDGMERLAEVLKRTDEMQLEDVKDAVLGALWTAVEGDPSRVAVYLAVKAGIVPVLLRQEQTERNQVLLVECLSSEAGEMWLEEAANLELIRAAAPSLPLTVTEEE